MKDKKAEAAKLAPTFLVNKTGFPLTPDTLDSLWNYVGENFPDGRKYEERIRGNTELLRVSMPSLPSLNNQNLTLSDKLKNIQNYMNQLQYNHTGMQFFEVKKYRPISGLMEVAREIIKESLPIKCLEAVILAIYLTSGIKDLQRFAISFKTKFGKNVHRHVVLGVYNMAGSSYGALGMSRRKTLMDKPVHFKSLSSLIMDFKESYEDCQHVVKKVKLSLPIVHDLRSCEKIHWRYLTLPVFKITEEDLKIALDKYSKELRIL